MGNNKQKHSYNGGGDAASKYYESSLGIWLISEQLWFAYWTVSPRDHIVIVAAGSYKLLSL